MAADTGDIAPPAPRSFFYVLLRELAEVHDLEVKAARGQDIESHDKEPANANVESSPDTFFNTITNLFGGDSSVSAVPSATDRTGIKCTAKSNHPGVEEAGVATVSPKSTWMDQNKVLADRVSGIISPSPSYLSSYESAFTDYAILKGWQTIKTFTRKGSADMRTPCINVCAQIVERKSFDLVCAFLIVTNAILLGVLTDFESRGEDVPRPLSSLNRLFTLLFCVELLIRICSYGIPDFILFSPTAAWNCFDCVVVFLDVMEHTILALSSQAQNMFYQIGLLRILRVLRIARAVRVVRLFHFFHELRLMVLSVLRCATTLFWSIVCLLMLLYIFSVYLLMRIAPSLHTDDAGLEPEVMSVVLKHFTSMTVTMYTLFQAVSGGQDWGDLCDALFKIRWDCGLVMCFYMFFTVFAMMNIITGIFVESAFDSVHNDREEVIQEEMQAESSAIGQLKAIFKHADADHDGTLTFAEFEAVLQEHRTVLLLKRIGIEVHAARGLFRLLDLGKEEKVDAQEFLVGCMRLRGGAKSVDLATLIFENKKMMVKWADFFKYIKTEFQLMRRFQNYVTTMLEPDAGRRERYNRNPFGLAMLSNESLEDETKVAERHTNENFLGETVPQTSICTSRGDVRSTKL